MAAFVLVLIAAIFAGLATFRGYLGAPNGQGPWYGGFDLLAAALCLYFIAVLLGLSPHA